MDEKAITRLSRFLSMILRHKPEEIGITLDANGWADVEELMNGVNRSGRRIDVRDGTDGHRRLLFLLKHGDGRDPLS